MSFQHHGATSATVFAGQTIDEHLLTHDASAQGQVHDAVMATMRRCAYLLEKLRATPDGTGNLLDRSCILVAMISSHLAGLVSAVPAPRGWRRC